MDHLLGAAAQVQLGIVRVTGNMFAENIAKGKEVSN